MVGRMAHLELFENKVKSFDFQDKFRFNENSRLLIAVPRLDLQIGEDPEQLLEKQEKEAEMFADYLRETIGAEVVVLAKLEEIDEVIADKPVDCLIDLHELHSKQKDFLLSKIKKPEERNHHRFIELYP